MQVTVNGQSTNLEDGATVADLIRLFALAPERIAVELNHRLVRRANYGQTPLHDGDQVEIVTLVGGG